MHEYYEWEMTTLLYRFLAMLNRANQIILPADACIDIERYGTKEHILFYIYYN